MSATRLRRWLYLYKTTWQDFETLDKILIVLFCVLMLVANIFLLYPNGDDIYFSSVPQSLWEFTTQRIQGWSSRTLIEVLVYVFTKTPIVLFGIINSIMACAFPFLLAQLASVAHSTRKALFPAISLMFMYPFLDMGTAGWQTTLINYFWPAFAATAAGLILQRQIQRNALSLYAQAGGLAALLLASNCEQLCAYILLLLPFVFWYEKGQVPRLFWGYTCICLLSITYMLVIPGNAARLIVETSTWMPAFAHLSMTQKFLAGYTSTVFHLMLSMSYIYYALAGLVLIHVLTRFSHPIYHILAILPLTTLLVPAFSLPNNYLDLQYIPQEALGQYVAIFISTISILALAFCILLIVPKLRDAIFILGVLGAGLVQRILVGFSPTLYASSTRTFLFLYLGIGCVLIWLYVNLENTLSPQMRDLTRLFIVCISSLAIINTNVPVLLKWLTAI